MWQRTLVVGSLVAGTVAISASPAAANPMCNGLAATIVVPVDAFQVEGTPGNDVIVVLADGAELRAGAGNDTICSSLANPNQSRKPLGSVLLVAIRPAAR